MPETNALTNEIPHGILHLQEILNRPQRFRLQKPVLNIEEICGYQVVFNLKMRIFSSARAMVGNLGVCTKIALLTAVTI